MQVSKHVIVAAAVAFALLIGAVGYLLGRESRRPRALPALIAAAPASFLAATPGLAPPSSPASPILDDRLARAPHDPAPYAPLPTAAPPPVPVPTPATPTPALPTPAPPTAAPPPALPDAAPSPSIAIRDYFVQMASIQSAGPTGDPTEMANTLLAAAAGGDASGFTALIKDVDDGIARAQQVQVPAPCQDYHQKTLALLAESGRMLRTLQSSIARADTAGLAALAASATSLQSRADALTTQASQIRARYGLAH